MRAKKGHRDEPSLALQLARWGQMFNSTISDEFPSTDHTHTHHFCVWRSEGDGFLWSVNVRGIFFWTKPDCLVFSSYRHFSLIKFLPCPFFTFAPKWCLHNLTDNQTPPSAPPKHRNKCNMYKWIDPNTESIYTSAGIGIKSILAQ